MRRNPKNITQVKCETNPMCYQCKGTCWVPKNQKMTQEKAFEMFGIIPNHCVNGQNGEIRCPYRKNQSLS